MSTHITVSPQNFYPTTVEQTMFFILSHMLVSQRENVAKGHTSKSGDYSLSFLRKRLPNHSHNIFEAMQKLQALGFVTKVRATAWSFVTENADKANDYIRYNSPPMQTPRFVPGMDFQNHMYPSYTMNQQPWCGQPSWAGNDDYRARFAYPFQSNQLNSTDKAAIESANLSGETEESGNIATAGMLVKGHFISSKQADEIFTYFGRLLLNDKIRKELNIEDPVPPTTIELSMVFQIAGGLNLTHDEMLQLLKEISELY